ncbi:MAG: thioredoxin family protein [Sediminibacterium sp.]|nr:thioredoxin family protein [Sediminibacterium sp.]
MIKQEELVRPMNYNAYRTLLDTLMADHRTTGNDQSEDHIAYAKMNLQRMQRLEKTTVINDRLKAAIYNLKQPLHLLALTEGWCGDAAQNLPVFHTMEQLAPDKIKLEVVLRDENLDLMDQYLTNGGRAIPKVIARFVNTEDVVFAWGPRPATAQQIMLEMKAKNASVKEKGEAIHLWYAKDKTQSLQNELADLLEQLIA